jgi:LSD1 subclass zinc finger protein
MAGSSHYEILDVTISATSDEIKAAYRRASIQVHPDRGGNNALFRLIQEAYETLSDPERRLEYDRSRSGPTTSAPPSKTSPSAPSPPSEDTPATAGFTPPRPLLPSVSCGGCRTTITFASGAASFACPRCGRDYYRCKKCATYAHPARRKAGDFMIRCSKCRTWNRMRK